MEKLLMSILSGINEKISQKQTHKKAEFSHYYFSMV